MREIRTSGLMSGDGKRGYNLPRPSSTLLPCAFRFIIFSLKQSWLVTLDKTNLNILTYRITKGREKRVMKITPGNLEKRELHELFMSAILPRPIAFVSTIGEDGVFNAAPFSCVAPIGLKPALVCFNIDRKRNGQLWNKNQ